MLQCRRNFYQRFNVDIGSVEDTVNVGAVAVELPGEPRGAAALALKFGFYQVSDVHFHFIKFWCFTISVKNGEKVT